MKIRPATIHDYKELAEMFKALIDDLYQDIGAGEDIFFYGAVQMWFQDKKDVIIAETDYGKIAGFTLAWVENLGFIKPYYFGDIAYVKPQYRKTRAAYLLYNNVIDYAMQQGLPVIAKAYVGGNDKVDKIQAKFGKPKFIEYYKGLEDG